LGLQTQNVVGARQWQIGVSYKYANTSEFFVGRKRDDSAGPFGAPPRRKVLTWALDVMYGVTDRVSVDVTVPYFSSTGGAEQGTAQSHSYREVHLAGVGDVALTTDVLVTNPRERTRGWVSVGLGFKAPTGGDSATALSFNFNPPIERPIDEAFQPGAGGWVMLVRAQAAAPITPRLSTYGGAFYGVSLTEHTSIVQNGAFRAVPDAFSARAGLAWLPSPRGALAVSAGGRMFGITRRDVLHGENLHFRRPGYEVFFEPGVAWASTANTVSLSLPIRVAQNKLDSYLDESRRAKEGAGFVPYLVIVSYARRF
jgi:hypothetical protein